MYYLLLLIALTLDGPPQQMQVVDSETIEAIPFVNIWLKGSRSGTSADSNGYFSLSARKQDTVLFSAVGYATKEIVYSEMSQRIELEQVATYLQEVSVQPTQEKEWIINAIRSRNCDYLYGVGDTKEPWMIGTRIFFQEGMRQANKLEKLRFQTRCDVKSGLMNVRLYVLDSAGFPSEFLLPENLLVELKKGKKTNEIDLSGYDLQFPSLGIAVIAEWFVLPRNRHEYVATIEGQKGKEVFVSYEPALCTRVSEDDGRGIIFWDGKWTLAEKVGGEFREFKVELTLKSQ